MIQLQKDFILRMIVDGLVFKLVIFIINIKIQRNFNSLNFFHSL